MNKVPKSEIQRKGIHLLSSIIPMSYLFFTDERTYYLIYLGILIIFSILLEYGRNRIPVIQSVFQSYFNSMLRTHEAKGAFTGASWVLFGMFISILLFHPYIAVLALLFMSFGDTCAALVGKMYPKGPLFGKTVSGSLGGLGSMVLLSFFFNPYVPFLPAVTGALVATIVEVLPIPLDDNITIPLSAGVTITFMTGGFG